MPNYKQYIKQVYFLSGNKKILALVGMFLLTSFFDIIGIGLIAPYVALIISPESFDQSIFYNIIDYLDTVESQQDLQIFFGIALIVVFFAKTLFAILVNQKIWSYCYDEGVNIRIKLMKAYQNMPYDNYLKGNSSDYIHNIQIIANNYSLTILQSILRIVSEGIVALFIFILLFIASGSSLLILVALLGGAIYFYDYFFRVKGQKYGKLSNKHLVKMFKLVGEALEGLKELRVLGVEKYFFSGLKKESKNYAKYSVKNKVIATAPRYLLELILVIFIVLVVSSSTLFFDNPKDFLPILSMFGLASIRLLPSTNQMLTGITQVRQGQYEVERIYKVIANANEGSSNEFDKAKSTNKTKFKNIALKDVSFSYELDGIEIIKGLSIKINRGDSIGIMGPSGSGKTTVIDLLLGLLKPTKGSLIYNDEPILNSNINDWISQVAYLPQNIFLTDDTIRNNIALGILGKDIDDKKLEDSINKSQLSDLIQNLEEGVDTFIGERGVRLSGGQRQRIALARAFYHSRDILIMDESTSALDSETEKEVVSEIQQLKGRKTLIVIAHRLSTLKYCDVIYRIDNGIIKEMNNELN
jgi:ATP-binding cassette, subfamily B, bacterial PglK